MSALLGAQKLADFTIGTEAVVRPAPAPGDGRQKSYVPAQPVELMSGNAMTYLPKHAAEVTKVRAKFRFRSFELRLTLLANSNCWR